MLLKNGANVNITDHDMVTPLHLVATPGSNKDIKEVVKMMVDEYLSFFSTINSSLSSSHLHFP